MNKNILTPYVDLILGQLQTRIAMAAMTRSFADPAHLCTDLMRQYYECRAADGVGLILTEGIIIHPSGDGYQRTPHLWNDAQAVSWQATTGAVHQHDGKIFAQLWHCGRISHTDFTNGIAPVSSSNLTATGINRQNDQPYSQPRALDAAEISVIIEQFIHSGKLALQAGFDGIELHCGHGYLIDQFFDSRINNRTDSYGGSVINRCRFALELITRAITEFGRNRVMVRISPSRFMGELYDWPDLEEMLIYLIPELVKIDLRLLDVSCANADYFQTSGRIIRAIRADWPFTILGGASLTLAQAQTEVDAGIIDIVTWGRQILANSDFVTRLKENKALVPFERNMLDTLV